MSDEKKVSERDAVFRERAAFVNGAAYATCCGPNMTDARSAIEAQGQYPLPEVKRPRVVRDDTGMCRGVYWRISGGRLQWSYNAERDWRNAGTSGNEPDDTGSGSMFVHLERVRVLADLLANPLEEVEAE